MRLAVLNYEVIGLVYVPEILYAQFNREGGHAYHL